MSWLRNQYPFTRARAVVIACGLLLGAARAVGASDDADARFHGPPSYDLAVTNVKWEAATEQYSYLTFDLSWSYSWRASWVEDGANNVTGAPLKVENWDAAWVFVKFLPEKDSKESIERNHWRHATLSTDAAHHVMPAGAASTIGLTDDGRRGMGVFVYRDAIGHGRNDFRQIKLRWLHAADKVDPRKAALAVHPIAMVYVPQGPFKVGTGGKTKVGKFPDGPTVPIVGWLKADNEECGSLADGSWRGGPTVPFLVDADWNGPVAQGTSARRIGPVAGQLWGTLIFDTHNRCSQLSTIGVPGALSDDFPTGYNAFYCMKYELTQGQYAALLNSLPPDVAATRAFISGDGAASAPSQFQRIEVNVGAGYQPHMIKEQDGHTFQVSGEKILKIPIAPDAGKGNALDRDAASAGPHPATPRPGYDTAQSVVVQASRLPSAGRLSGDALKGAGKTPAPQPPPAGSARADTIKLTNVKWEAGTEQHSYVRFDLSWEDSWRAAWSEAAEKNVTGAPLKLESWDVAWVFVKFRHPGASVFSPATLSIDAAHHGMPAGAASAVGRSDDGKKGTGVFVYRDQAGRGPNHFKNVRLRWLHGADKVEPGKVTLAVAVHGRRGSERRAAYKTDKPQAREGR